MRISKFKKMVLTALLMISGTFVSQYIQSSEEDVSEYASLPTDTTERTTPTTSQEAAQQIDEERERIERATGIYSKFLTPGEHKELLQLITQGGATAEQRIEELGEKSAVVAEEMSITGVFPGVLDEAWAIERDVTRLQQAPPVIPVMTGTGTVEDIFTRSKFSDVEADLDNLKNKAAEEGDKLDTHNKTLTDLKRTQIGANTNEQALQTEEEIDSHYKTLAGIEKGFDSEVAQKATELNEVALRSIRAALQKASTDLNEYIIDAPTEAEKEALRKQQMLLKQISDDEEGIIVQDGENLNQAIAQGNRGLIRRLVDRISQRVKTIFASIKNFISQLRTRDAFSETELAALQAEGAALVAQEEQIEQERLAQEAAIKAVEDFDKRLELQSYIDSLEAKKLSQGVDFKLQSKLDTYIQEKRLLDFKRLSEVVKEVESEKTTQGTSQTLSDELADITRIVKIVNLESIPERTAEQQQELDTLKAEEATRKAERAAQEDLARSRDVEIALLEKKLREGEEVIDPTTGVKTRKLPDEDTAKRIIYRVEELKREQAIHNAKKEQLEDARFTREVRLAEIYSLPAIERSSDEIFTLKEEIDAIKVREAQIDWEKKKTEEAQKVKALGLNKVAIEAALETLKAELSAERFTELAEELKKGVARDIAANESYQVIKSPSAEDLTNLESLEQAIEAESKKIEEEQRALRNATLVEERVVKKQEVEEAETQYESVKAALNSATETWKEVGGQMVCFVDSPGRCSPADTTLTDAERLELETRYLDVTNQLEAAETVYQEAVINLSEKQDALERVDLSIEENNVQIALAQPDITAEQSSAFQTRLNEINSNYRALNDEISQQNYQKIEEDEVDKSIENYAEVPDVLGLTDEEIKNRLDTEGVTSLHLSNEEKREFLALLTQEQDGTIDAEDITRLEKLKEGPSELDVLTELHNYGLLEGAIFTLTPEERLELLKLEIIGVAEGGFDNRPTEGARYAELFNKDTVILNDAQIKEMLHDLGQDPTRVALNLTEEERSELLKLLIIGYAEGGLQDRTAEEIARYTELETKDTVILNDAQIKEMLHDLGEDPTRVALNLTPEERLELLKLQIIGVAEGGLQDRTAEEIARFTELETKDTVILNDAQIIDSLQEYGVDRERVTLSLTPEERLELLKLQIIGVAEGGLQDRTAEEIARFTELETKDTLILSDEEIIDKLQEYGVARETATLNLTEEERLELLKLEILGIAEGGFDESRATEATRYTELINKDTLVISDQEIIDKLDEYGIPKELSTSYLTPEERLEILKLEIMGREGTIDQAGQVLHAELVALGQDRESRGEVVSEGPVLTAEEAKNKFTASAEERDRLKVELDTKTPGTPEWDAARLAYLLEAHKAADDWTLWQIYDVQEQLQDTTLDATQIAELEALLEKRKAEKEIYDRRSFMSPEGHLALNDRTLTSERLNALIAERDLLTPGTPEYVIAGDAVLLENEKYLRDHYNFMEAESAAKLAQEQAKPAAEQDAAKLALFQADIDKFAAVADKAELRAQFNIEEIKNDIERAAAVQARNAIAAERDQFPAESDDYKRLQDEWQKAHDKLLVYHFANLANLAKAELALGGVDEARRVELEADVTKYEDLTVAQKEKVGPLNSEEAKSKFITTRDERDRLKAELDTKTPGTPEWNAARDAYLLEANKATDDWALWQIYDIEEQLKDTTLDEATKAQLEATLEKRKASKELAEIRELMPIEGHRALDDRTTFINEVADITAQRDNFAVGSPEWNGFEDQRLLKEEQRLLANFQYARHQEEALKAAEEAKPSYEQDAAKLAEMADNIAKYAANEITYGWRVNLPVEGIKAGAKRLESLNERNAILAQRDQQVEGSPEWARLNVDYQIAQDKYLLSDYTRLIYETQAQVAIEEDPAKRQQLEDAIADYEQKKADKEVEVREAVGMTEEERTTLADDAKSKAKDLFEKLDLEFSILVGLPEGFSWPVPLNFLLDQIPVEKVGIILANSSYDDIDWNLEVEPGINLVADILSGGVLDELGSALKADRLRLHGSLHTTEGVAGQTTYAGSVFRAKVPGTLDWGILKGYEAKLIIEVEEEGPVFKVGAAFTLQLPGQDEPIVLNGELGVSVPLLFHLEAYMQGLWENAFGVPGLGIGELIVKSKVDPINFPWLKALGLGGKLCIGDVCGKVITWVDLTDTTGVLVLVDIEELFIDKIVGAAFAMAEAGADATSRVIDGLPLPYTTPEGSEPKSLVTPPEVAAKIQAVSTCTMVKDAQLGGEVENISCSPEAILTIGQDQPVIQPKGNDPTWAQQVKEINDQILSKLPNIGIKKLFLQVVSGEFFFGGQYYTRGLTFEGEVELLDQVFKAKFALSPLTGIEALAYMNDLTIGPFSITGAGEDKVRGTEDDGPIFVLNANPRDPLGAELYLDAAVSADILGGLDVDTRVYITPFGFKFLFDMNLADQFEVEAEASAEVASPQDWLIAGKFKQSALDQLTVALQTAVTELVAGADVAADTLRQQRAEIEAQVQQEIAQAKAAVQARLDSLQSVKDDLDQQIAQCRGESPKRAHYKVEEYRIKPLTEEEITGAVTQLGTDGFSPEQIEYIKTAVTEPLKAQSEGEKTTAAQTKLDIEEEARQELAWKAFRDLEKDWEDTIASLTQDHANQRAAAVNQSALEQSELDQKLIHDMNLKLLERDFKLDKRRMEAYDYGVVRDQLEKLKKRAATDAEKVQYDNQIDQLEQKVFDDIGLRKRKYEDEEVPQEKSRYKLANIENEKERAHKAINFEKDLSKNQITNMFVAYKRRREQEIEKLKDLKNKYETDRVIYRNARDQADADKHRYAKRRDKRKEGTSEWEYYNRAVKDKRYEKKFYQSVIDQINDEIANIDNVLIPQQKDLKSTANSQEDIDRDKVNAWANSMHDEVNQDTIREVYDYDVNQFAAYYNG